MKDSSPKKQQHGKTFTLAIQSVNILTIRSLKTNKNFFPHFKIPLRQKPINQTRKTFQFGSYPQCIVVSTVNKTVTQVSFHTLSLNEEHLSLMIIRIKPTFLCVSQRILNRKGIIWNAKAAFFPHFY